MSLAWHYTIAQRAVDVIAAGELRPSAPFIGMRGAVWFSTRQDVEPSIVKLRPAPGGPRLLSVLETHQQGAGLWRFGMPADQLLPWADLRAAVGITRHQARALEGWARKQGADVADWLGVVGVVSLDRLVVERLPHRYRLHGWKSVPDPQAYRDETLAEAIRLEFERVSV